MRRRRGPRPAVRLVTLLCTFAALLTVLAGRLVQLQVVQAEPLGSRGLEQRVRKVALPALRGTIYDRSMQPLAMSMDARAIFADTRGIENPAAEALRLAPLLGVDEGTLVERLAKPAGFVYLARRVPMPAARAVAELDLHYIGMHAETQRAYPDGTVAGQVLGFVGVDDQGLAGIESRYEDILSGTPGLSILERDPRGRPIPQGQNRLVEPIPGKGLVLTIDRDLQFTAEDALRRGVRATGARDGQAIVMDPRTGDVLAMANWPPLDPARFNEASADRHRNRIVTDAYEPGSVNKVITAAAAIDAGLASPEERLRLPRAVVLGGKDFKDMLPLGSAPVTYSHALAQSSNVASIMIAQRLGPRRFYEALRRFGLGSPTGIGFPGESAGILAPPSEWSGTSMGTIPIGQGIATTALQVASVYATIANDGVRVQPRLVRGVVEEDGAVTPVPVAKPERVIKAYTAAQVRGMLIDVVEHGTGRRAQIPGYLVGGKTGTARIPLADRLGYSNDIITTFAGMAPADDPRVVVLVSLNNPTPRMAALTAAPIFREIVTYALPHLQIPPTVTVHDPLSEGRSGW